MKIYDYVLDGVLLLIITYHLLIAPYTKVEESFNIQAIHDILNYGIFPSSTIVDNYDHVQFPGVVPRTFIGSLALAGIVKGINVLTSWFGHDIIRGQMTQEYLLLVVRALLGVLNALLLMLLRDSVNRITLRKKLRGSIGTWFMFLLLTQFHLLYYASRTLPNFIALPIVVLALGKIVEGDLSGLFWLAFSGIVFRLEIGLLAGIIALVSSLGFKQSKLHINIIMLVGGTITGLVATILVDSYFWGRWIVPELESFVFNIVDGKSAEWGVEPWSAYFKLYFFQLFRPPIVLLLALPGLYTDPADDGSPRQTISHPARHSLRILFVSSVLYVVGMSFQPHKEWRFIIYIVPVFTLLAATGLARISNLWTRFMSRLTVLLLVISSISAIVSSLLMGYISSFNYPGADALAFANSHIMANFHSKPVLIHMDVASCMSGINRFGQLHIDNVTYDKTESTTELTNIWNNIDILITENDIPMTQTLNPHNWKKLYIARIYSGITIEPLFLLGYKIVNREGLVTTLIKSSWKEAKEGQATTLLSILNSLIKTEELIYVYERKGLDDISAVRASLETVSGNKLNEEEVNEVDPNEIKEEINQEIDELEAYYEDTR